MGDEDLIISNMKSFLAHCNPMILIKKGREKKGVWRQRGLFRKDKK